MSSAGSTPNCIFNSWGFDPSPPSFDCDNQNFTPLDTYLNILRHLRIVFQRGTYGLLSDGLTTVSKITGTEDIMMALTTMVMSLLMKQIQTALRLWIAQLEGIIRSFNFTLTMSVMSLTEDRLARAIPENATSLQFLILRIRSIKRLQSILTQVLMESSKTMDICI